MDERAVEACRGKLRGVLQRANVCRVSPGQIGHNGDLRPYTDEAHKHLGKWMREFELTHMVWKHIESFIRAHPTESLGTDPKPLSAIVSGTGIDAITDTVLDDIRSVPRKYSALILLPRFFPTGVGTVQIANGVEIIEKQGSEAFELLRATHSQQQPLKRSETSTLSLPFLKVAAEGYYLPQNATANKLVGRVKQVISLMLAGQILHYNYIGERSDQAYIGTAGPASPEYSYMLVSDATGSMLDVRLMPAQMPRLVNVITFYRNMWFPPKVVNQQFDPDVTDRQIGLKIAETSRSIKACFENEKANSDILAAAQWLFDSETIEVENETYAFLYAAIGLESILGSPEDDITKTLGDRLAYLVGTSRSDRRAIQDRFTKFYKHRSKIVHGKSVALAESDLEQMRWGRRMLKRVLRQELALIEEKQRPWHDPIE